MERSKKGPGVPLPSPNSHGRGESLRAPATTLYLSPKLSEGMDLAQTGIKRFSDIHASKLHGAVRRSEAKIKEPRAPPRGSTFRLSTVRDHEGAGQLDPQTVANSNTVRRPSSQFKPLTTSNSAERGGENRYFLTLVPAANVGGCCLVGSDPNLGDLGDAGDRHRLGRRSKRKRKGANPRHLPKERPPFGSPMIPERSTSLARWQICLCLG
jgi:hypothetical protein